MPMKALNRRQFFSMDRTLKLMELESLNRAFQKAFSHTNTNETLEDLLSCLGAELECERISIFEQGADGSFDNSYEWCASESDHRREVMHALPKDVFSRLMGSLRDQEYLCFQDIHALSRLSPEADMLLSSQGVRSLLAARLAFRGQELGLFLMENPGKGVLSEAPVLIPGIRYILSSLVYNDHLIRRIEHMGCRDQLTGMGNLSSMKARLAEIAPGTPAGLCYVETAGWKEELSAAGSLSTEQSLIRTGSILNGIFGEKAVFRVAANEFLIAVDFFPIPFDKAVENARTLLQNSGLICGIGFVFTDSFPKDPDPLIRQIHMVSHQDTHLRLREDASSSPDACGAAVRESRNAVKSAAISLFRTDAFFHAGEALMDRYPGHPMVTVVFDLNYFKLYNDIFGREAGNQFLEGIAESLRTQASALQGLAGYLGGDNFILLFPSPEQDGSELRGVIEGLIARLPYPDGFSPALGVCVSSENEPLTAMYDHALTALEEIKGSYVEHYRFYDADHFLRDRDNKLLIMAIRQGIDRNEFVFYLQPQVREQTGKIVGAEALCRWLHKGQVISPGQFIPTLEKTGMIYEIDSLIWEQVASWLRDCRLRGLHPLPVSVNVSRVDFFFTDIAEHFISLVKKYGIEPELLGIEITESAFADNGELMLSAVEKLHSAGFHVLMDDFGSGYSSLSMLHTMNLDVLKTDVKFMSRNESDTKAISIVESVVSMAHMIGMLVITEGIETEAQRESLISMGENYAQGFLFYHPMPPAEFEELIRDPDLLDKPYIRNKAGVRNHLHFREMVRSGLLSGSLLDNLIGPAAVLKKENGRLFIQQINNACQPLVGSWNVGPEGAPCETLPIAAALDRAARRPGQGISFRFQESGREVSGRAFLLYGFEQHFLYFVAFSPETVSGDRGRDQLQK